ncbi:MAG: hypothetical protein KAG66_21585 [Methylococcales bacterium]|nr:hypothetical protein [Methylococcales bacterium]
MRPYPTRHVDELSRGVHAGLAWCTYHNGMGFRCGYVRVMRGHPWFGCILSELSHIAVHGYVTYAENHLPHDEPVADEWWVGFDCGHVMIDAPDMTLISLLVDESQRATVMHCAELLTMPGGVVRSQEFVEEQCKKVCQQGKKASENYR